MWNDPKVIEWATLLLDSFRRWTGEDFMVRGNDPNNDAEQLFTSVFEVVSHGIEPDPILNYGNGAALHLWEMDWSTFISTPSRETAEEGDRAERDAVLGHVRVHGYLRGYKGVRITSSRRRFQIEDGTIWNVLDHDGQRVGQAALLSFWRYL
ncbi:MAG: MEKHLA domain-containing protein [bacterium]|nr:MEKHLA domain-containing protein [bacterium]